MENQFHEHNRVLNNMRSSNVSKNIYRLSIDWWFIYRLFTDWLWINAVVLFTQWAIGARYYYLAYNVPVTWHDIWYMTFAYGSMAWIFNTLLGGHNEACGEWVRH